jgi:hypothetical protein
MKFFMDTFQSILVNMGIYLSGGDVCMSQHHLHGTQVGAVTEKMGGKRVPEHMGGDFFINTGGQRCFSDYLPEPQSCHATAACGNKEIIASLAFEDEWPCSFEIIFDFFFCLVTEGNETFFIAFAQNPDKTGGKITGSQRKLDKFGHP